MDLEDNNGQRSIPLDSLSSIYQHNDTFSQRLSQSPARIPRSSSANAESYQFKATKVEGLARGQSQSEKLRLFPRLPRKPSAITSSSQTPPTLKSTTAAIASASQTAAMSPPTIVSAAFTTITPRPTPPAITVFKSELSAVRSQIRFYTEFCDSRTTSITTYTYRNADPVPDDCPTVARPHQGKAIRMYICIYQLNKRKRKREESEKASRIPDIASVSTVSHILPASPLLCSHIINTKYGQAYIRLTRGRISRAASSSRAS